ncbi:MAG: hypothetical protein JW940_05175 [Polyangiaceae bacterium]|nr:hypothetical protein [Polyangiaceae bacterium]
MEIEIPELRPPAIGVEVVPQLHELRKFRHFFRNAYVLELEPHRVRDRARDLVRAHPPTELLSRALLDHVARSLAEVRGGG